MGWGLPSLGWVGMCLWVGSWMPLKAEVSTLADGNMPAFPDSLVPTNALRVRQITRTAALLPGAGALMNAKYWKAPLVWAGWGFGVWNIHRQTEEFRSYRAAFVAETDGNPDTEQFTGLSAQALNDQTLLYRRKRDVAWMALAGFHLLSILDAHVDAQLADFDVGPNLKAWWQVTPSDVILADPMRPTDGAGWMAQVGIRWTLSEKPQL